MTAAPKPKRSKKKAPSHTAKRRRAIAKVEASTVIVPSKLDVAPERLEKLRQLLRTQGAKYLDQPGVTSVGLGLLEDDRGVVITNGGMPQMAIQFTVERKFSPEEIRAEGLDALPEYFELDGERIPTNVIQRSFKSCYKLVDTIHPQAAGQPRRTRREPLVPGISVAHEALSAGTIGAIVFDGQTGAPYVLSNWHVLHGASGSIGDTVVQPGPHDDNRDVIANRIGRLVRSHLGLAGDCAIASIESRQFLPQIQDLGVVPRRVADPEIGDRVVKSGRTTGVTHGIVSRIEVTAKVPYPDMSDEIKIGAFEIRPNPQRPPEDGEISKGGDSGSLWLVDGRDDQDVALGLHFAGESDPAPGAEHALACPLRTVLRKLEVSLERPQELPAIQAHRVSEVRSDRGAVVHGNDRSSRATAGNPESLEEVQRIKAELWGDASDVSPEDVDPKYRLVAEGDSWFDYLPGLDILDQLKRNHGYAIRKIAEAGDTLENMIYGTEIRRDFSRKDGQIEETLRAIKEFRPSVFLFSGGGNDLAGVELEGYLNHRDSGLDPLRKGSAEYLISTVTRRAFEHLVSRVADADPKVKILVHGYARPVADGRGVLNFPFGFRFIGPWLRPAFSKKGIGVSDGTRLIGELIDRFNEMLAALAASSGGRVRHVDLRNLVLPGDWVNELHLRDGATRTVALRFHQIIQGNSP